MSDFPNVSWLDFASFIKQINIVDNQMNLSTIDRIFIATNHEIE